MSFSVIPASFSCCCAGLSFARAISTSLGSFVAAATTGSLGYVDFTRLDHGETVVAPGVDVVTGTVAFGTGGGIHFAARPSTSDFAGALGVVDEALTAVADVDVVVDVVVAVVVEVDATCARCGSGGVGSGS